MEQIYKLLYKNPYVLVVFAFDFCGTLPFSMFGYFEIKLPQSIQTKLNKTTDGKEKQGIAGIAIMGFLSALIVGSLCCSSTCWCF